MCIYIYIYGKGWETWLEAAHGTSTVCGGPLTRNNILYYNMLDYNILDYIIIH